MTQGSIQQKNIKTINMSNSHISVCVHTGPHTWDSIKSHLIILQVPWGSLVLKTKPGLERLLENKEGWSWHHFGVGEECSTRQAPCQRKSNSLDTSSIVPWETGPAACTPCRTWWDKYGQMVSPITWLYAMKDYTSQNKLFELDLETVWQPKSRLREETWNVLFTSIHFAPAENILQGQLHVECNSNWKMTWAWVTVEPTDPGMGITSTQHEAVQRPSFMKPVREKQVQSLQLVTEKNLWGLQVDAAKPECFLLHHA